MMKIWEKLESKSSYHFPNSWWVRGGKLLNTCHLKKLWRGQEDQRKPRTSELFNSETLKHFNVCMDVSTYISFNFWQSQLLILFQCPSAFRDGEKLELQIFVHLYLVTVTFDTEAELLVICLCWLEHGMGAQHRYYRYILSTAGNVVSLLSRFGGHLGSGGTRQTGAQ